MMAAPVMYLSHTAELSGAEMSLLSLMAALDRSRFAPVAVLPGTGPFLDRLVEEGIPAHVLPLTPGSVRRPGEILRNTRMLRAFGSAHGIRLVHANSFHAIKQAAPGRRMGNTPLVGHIRDIVPFTRLTRAAILSCDRVVCVSEATAANLTGAGPDRRERRIRVIHNGVDPAAFADPPPRREALEALGLPEQRHPVVGMAAPLVRWKGQAVFLEAAALAARRLPDAAFVVAGGDRFAEPGYVEELQALASSPELEGRVIFPGFVRDVRRLFAALDVVVCPSVAPDPLPRSVLEALSAGLAVVASATGGLPEIIDHGLTGLLVPPSDPGALAEEIVRLAKDGNLRKRLGGQAALGAAERFSLAAHAGRIMDLYRELLTR